jgi:hypothetical protein
MSIDATQLSLEVAKDRAMTTAADLWTPGLLKAGLEDQAEWRRRKIVEYPDSCATTFASEPRDGSAAEANAVLNP